MSMRGRNEVEMDHSDSDMEDSLMENGVSTKKSNKKSKMYDEDDSVIQQRSNDKSLLMRTQAELDQTLTKGKYKGKSIEKKEFLPQRSKPGEGSEELDKLNELMEYEQYSVLEQMKERIENEDSDDEIERLAANRREVTNLLSNTDTKNLLFKGKVRSKEEEIGKAMHVSNQKKMYEQVLKWRIMIQKQMNVVNRLPQKSMMRKFVQSLKEKEETNIGDAMEEVNSNLVDSLVDMMNVQHDMYNLNDAHRSKGDSKEVGMDGDAMKEKVFSFKASNESSLYKKYPMREKKLSMIWDSMNKNFTANEAYINKSIDKWYKRTQSKLAKSLKTVGKNATEAVHSELVHNRDALVQRTRKNHSKERVLGKIVNEEDSVDEEIFDDKEFYQKQLKSLIQEAGSSMLGGVPRNGESVDYEKLKKQIKQKKKIELQKKLNALSKDRIIKYNVHEELVNFMAPVEHAVPDTAESLFNSLFGGNTLKSFKK